MTDHNTWARRVRWFVAALIIAGAAAVAVDHYQHERPTLVATSAPPLLVAPPIPRVTTTSTTSSTIAPPVIAEIADVRQAPDELVSATPAPTEHLDRIRRCESRDNYGSVSETGKYRGAYQFSRATWDSTARRAGRSDLVGVDPATASVADQDAMALALYQSSGPGQWPHCQHA